MSRVVLSFPADTSLGARIAQALGARLAPVAWRHFPDGESLVTIDPGLEGADVAILASLRGPDALALPLRFAAATTREFGARSVGLIAPYLAYMRQDTRFERGQAVSAPLFARFLEDTFDWLVTVDPHLHRISALNALYRMPVEVVAAAPIVADWIATHVPDAVVIGPDSESRQWVAAVADAAGVPYQVLAKTRRGDTDVEVSLPDREGLAGRTPVLVDDIVSSGRTIIETIGHLARLGVPAPVVVAIHPVFAGEAYTALQAAGATRVISTDTIAHPSNAISMAPSLAACAAVRILDVANREVLR